MKKNDPNHTKLTNLRKKAEDKLRLRSTKIDDLDQLAYSDIRKLAHELKVYEIELEMQNEELRKDQIVIAESQKKYSNLYDFAPIGYFTLDENGVILEANLTGATMLGTDRQSLIKKPVSLFIPRENTDQFYLYRKDIIENKKGLICKTRMINKKNGEIFYAKIEGKTVQTDGVETKQLWLIISDITEEKEADAHIRKLSQIIEQSPTSVVITKRDGNIEYVNPQFTKITGYSREEVIGKKPRILKSGMQPYDVYLKLWSTIIAGYEWKGRVSNRKKNGEVYAEYMSISPLKDESDHITHFVAVKIDDTERIKAEELARKSERRLARILEISADAIISTNDKQNITVFNKGAETVFGYDSSEIITRPLEVLIPERFLDVYRKEMVNFSKSKKEFIRLNEKYFDLYGLKKGGKEFPADISISKVDEDGKIVYTTIFRDITSSKKMEDEILKGQKLDSVGVLAGGIAHDFNNILTAILGNTNLADIYLDSNDFDKVHKTHKNIETATIMAKGLTQQLLTFSKGGEPVKKTFTIAKHIKEASNFAVRGSNVKCEFDMPDNLWMVNADEGQLNQVINNLVLNAVHAMPEGGSLKVVAENITKISVNLTNSLKQGKYVKFSFTDSGIGIKEEHCKKIFDPYFTTKQKGSGLGLASSYSIIKKHDGLITVESEFGIGTTFSIYLPASIEKPKTVDTQEKKIVTGKGRVLVMDDNEGIRFMTSQSLGYLGYDVEVAKDGKEAIELYKKSIDTNEPFDLFILDLTIPAGMGGEEAIKEIHKIDDKAKAIVFSGYSNDQAFVNYKKYGFNGFLTKPFEINELSEIVQKVINE